MPMQSISKLLPQYTSIVNDTKKAKYLSCKKIAVSFDKKESTQTLWKKHTLALKNHTSKTNTSKQNLLDLKIELAYRMMQSCILCERKCRVNRQKSLGDCNVEHSMISSEFLHRGEEYFLVPSHTIFFSGCNFHCVFCQNYDISQQACGVSINPLDLSTLFTERKQQGAKNVNWVGGDPTPHLHYMLTVLQHCTENIAQIFNSNMYCSEQTMQLLDGVIDVYLTDFKYGNDTCAQRLSKIADYSSIIQRNHILAAEQTDVLIRHLVLPNHSQCCTQPILQWIHNNIPNTPVHIMDQYRPMFQAKQYTDINCFLTKQEFESVKKTAETLHLYLI